MKPAEHDIKIYRGDNFELFFRVRELVWDSGISQFVPGNYINLTGNTGKAQLRVDEDSSTVAAEFTVTLGNQTTTPGSAFIRLTSAQTTALTIPTGKYDVQFTDGSNVTLTYLKGDAEIIKDVSRA